MSKCKNCHAELYGKFCSACGQKVYTEKDKSVKNLLHEAFHFITHFEGKFFNTLKTIFRYPGKLSIDYSQGIRQRYYKPISFYLLIVVLYLTFPLFSGLNMEMKYYKKNVLWGAYVSRQIEDKLTKEGITEAQLSDKFHQKSKSTSKVLLLLLIPLAVPILYLLYFNNKRLLFDNIILATELNTFYLLVIYILSPIVILPVIEVFKLTLTEFKLSLLLLVVFVTYATVLIQRVFKEKWWLSIIKGILLAFLHTVMLMMVYKGIVFEFTFAVI